MAEIKVTVGQSLQTAINNAQPGDVITLEAGVVYPANLTLPNKTAAHIWMQDDDSAYITIQSSRASELPEGVHVGPAQTALFARLQSVVNAEPVVKTAPGAHHYKFIGIQFETRDAGVAVYDLVRFGEGRGEQKTVESVPHHLIIDRSWVRGWPTQDVQRGVTVNSAHTDITNSYISDIHGVGYDTQAIAGWNGTNTVRIINNYLEAAGENVMFGGADSAATKWDADGKPIDGLMPVGIEIRRNYLFKPLSWKVGHPTYAGKHWTVKNLLELKAAKNVVIDGNVMENNWTDGQAGVAVLFTVRNQECSNPWATVQNVTFSNNTVKGSTGGALNLLGKDNEAEPAYGKCKDPATMGSIRGSGVIIFNNLFYDIGGSFLTLNGFDDVSVNRTTHVQRGNFTTIYGQPSQRWKYTENLMVDHIYGMYIEAGSGVKGLDILTPGWVLEQNVIIGATDPGSWPPNNQLVNGVALPTDFRSPYPGIGCDIDALKGAQSGSLIIPMPAPAPAPAPAPTPSPTPAPAPTTSPDNTRVPLASQIVDSTGGVWTLSGQTILRDGQETGGRGSLIVWYGGKIYAVGTDNNWWAYTGGTSWSKAAGDPAVSQPAPAPEPAPQPEPSPIPTPAPAPAPTVRVVMWPSTESGQTALWQNQAKEGYRPNKHVPRPANMPKGQYVEFVKF